MARAPQRSAPGAPSILVEPGSHTVAGGAGTVLVHARNVSGAAQQLAVRVVGLEADWTPTPVTALIEPDATVTVELVLTPPPGAAIGEYPFVVLVEATDQVDGAVSGAVSRTVADSSLRVDGASELVLSVEPADARALRGRRVELVLANTSAQATSVRLAGQADEGAEVVVPDRLIDVGPQQTVRVPVLVRASRVRLVGQQRRHAFTLTATGRSAPQRVQGTLSVRALLGSSLLRTVAMVTVIGLWVAGALVVLPRVTERFAGTTASAATSGPGQDATEGTGTGSGGAGGAAGPDGGAGGADGDPDGTGTTSGTDGASASVRGSGLVTGIEPGSVRVQLVPTSSLGAAEGATAAGGLTQAVPGVAPVAAARVAAGVAAGLLAGLPRPLRAVVELTGAVRDTSRDAGKVLATALAVERTDLVSPRLSTLTGSDGTWAFGGLSPSARYLVVLSKPGYQTQRVVLTGAELSAAPLEVELRPGDASLTGLVTGPDGAVGGVEVTITDGTTTVTTRTATSGQVGRWQVDGLTSPTTYLVTASSGALGAQSRLVGVGAGGALTVDLALAPGVASVSGTVVGTDSLGGIGGLGGLSVTASDGTTTRTSTTVTGEGAGVFVLPSLPVPGTYTVTVAGPGYATVTQQLDLTPAGVQGWEISVGSVGGSVQGTVQDGLGAGVAAAGLVLTGPAGIYKTMSSSDGSGTYRFAGIAPGEYVLSGEAFGYEAGYVQVGVPSGASVGADLVLVPVENDGLVATATITGRVTDASTGGQITCPVLSPGETCSITATVTTTDLHGATRVVTSVVDPDDPYRLPATPGDGLLPGRYTVTVTAPGYEPGTVQVTVPMGGIAEAATVALKPSPSLVGTVLARAGVLGDACVVVRAPGVTVADPCGADPAQCSSAAARCVKLVNGAYQLDRLRAGTYVVEVVGMSDDYVEPAAATLTLAAGDVRRYDVTVERRGIVNVTALRGGSGGSTAPAGGSWVRATRTGSPTVQVQAGTTGYAQLRGLDPGTWTVAIADTQGGAALRSTTAVIGLNQEINLQLVVTTAVGSQVVSVVTQLQSGHQTPVDSAKVTVTGTVGYTGVSPERRSETFVTVDGLATVCTSGCTPSLPLVDPLVDVEVTHLGYVTYTATGVTLDSLASITLAPAYATFAGSVVLSPVDPALTSSIVFDVASSPPGVGALSLSVGPDGTVTFTDSSQSGSNRIRPGTYTVTAQLAGHTSSKVTFEAPVRDVEGVPKAVTPAPRWELPKNGRLAIKVMGSDGLPVSGALVRLHQVDGPVVEVTAVGTAPVDFGDKPSGTFEIDVRAAGYAGRSSATVTLPAGGTYATPVEVGLTRLGTIAGSVVSTLGPGWTQVLPGATVTGSLGDVSFSATSSSAGSFALTGTRDDDGLLPGSWSVRGTAPGHLASAVVPVDVTGSGTVPLSPGTPPAPLSLAPEPSTLTVTVVDELVAQPGLTLELRYSEGGQVHRVEPCASVECQAEPTIYRFDGLLPVTYTLFVSGGNYLPMNVRVAIAAGEDPTLVVPITAPAGSLQGVVVQKSYGGVAAAVPGRTVVLAQTGLPDRSTTTDAEGAFVFAAVQAGTYQVHVRDAADTANQLSQRTSVLSGQSTVLSFELEPWYGSVVVQVRSANAADLSGALVTLTGTPTGGSATEFGPQPVVRAAGDGHTYTTTFNQVPTGSWTASTTGPAGHHGAHTGAVFSVALGAATTTTLVTVAETELLLRAQGPTAGPSTLQVQVTPTGLPAFTLTLVLGASDTVVHIPVGGAAVSASASGGWSTTVTPPLVGATATHQVVTVTLTGAATTTTAAVVPGSGVIPGAVVWGRVLPLRVTVARVSGPGTPSGEVQVSARIGGVVTVLGPGTLGAADGRVDVDVPTTALSVGPVELTVSYAGAGAWLGSSTTFAATVTTAPTATSWSTPPATALTAGDDLPLRVVVARQGAGAGGVPTGSVTVGGVTGGPVTATLDATGRASLTVPAAALPVGTHTVIVSYGGGGTWAASSVQTTVTVSAPEASSPGP